MDDSKNENHEIDRSFEKNHEINLQVFVALPEPFPQHVRVTRMADSSSLSAAITRIVSGSDLDQLSVKRFAFLV
jgi:hypothetical protein